MKTTMKFLFGTLLVGTLFFSSCTKNSDAILDTAINSNKEIQDDEVTEQNFELWMQQQMAKVEGELTVEQASLEEINAEMIANGLEPFTEEEVIEAQSRAIWDCGSWVFLGDWNNSGTLTTFDLVLAQQYLCNNAAGGCGGTIDTSTFPFNDPKAFGYLSFLEDGTDILLLNRDDIDAGRGRILGIIACL